MAAEVIAIADANSHSISDEKFARFLDENDELRSYRSEFHYPKNKNLPTGRFNPVLYLLGSSCSIFFLTSEFNLNSFSKVD